MNVLFVNRADVLSKPGGDTVQMQKTCEYLEKLGVSVTINTSGDVDFSPFDLVHIFNIQDPKFGLRSLRRAKRAGKKIALSTIYWNLEAILMQDYFSSPRFSLPRRLLRKKLSTALLAVYFRNIHRQQEAMLRQADLLLPNAEAEAEKLKKDFSGLDASKFLVIPNAVDPQNFSNARPELFKHPNHLDRYVLCVARVQRAKNQLNLIREMKNINTKLVLIGNVGEPSYYQECREEARNTDVLFLPFLPHDELKNAYAGALCHALPSLRETPGLSSLEAGICGCPVVSGTEGSQYEYFQNLAFYCDSSDPETIKTAIVQAIGVPSDRREKLKERILRHYTWTVTAQKTLEAYEKVLK